MEDAKAALSASLAATEAHGADLTVIRSPRSVRDVLRETVSSRSALANPGVVLVDVSIVARQLRRLQTLLPNCRMHFAVKSFPDPVVVSTLAHLDASFDCASRDELLQARGAIEEVLRSRRAGATDGWEEETKEVLSERVVYANPVKSLWDLREARMLGVRYVVVDGEEEVDKVYSAHPEAKCILRIATEDFSSQVPLSAKFGARETEARGILRRAREVGLKIIGVAFHVGSKATSTRPYCQALRQTRRLWDFAESLGLCMEIIDIGGGFPGCDEDSDVKVTTAQIASAVRHQVDTLFHKKCIRLFAEPGRFLAHSCATMASRIMEVSSTTTSGGEDGHDDMTRRPWARIGDGVWGTFRDAHVFGERYPTELLWGRCCREEGDETQQQRLWDVVGVTGDVGDVVERGVRLPSGLRRGDWLLFDAVGSYTYCLRSNRPDLPIPTRAYVFTL